LCYNWFCGNPSQLVLHYVLSFWFRLFGGSSTCISFIVLTKDCCSLCSFSYLAIYLFLISFLSLKTCSLITLFLVHVDIHYMNWRIGNLGFHHKWFLYSLHSFVLKHILHVTIFKTIYDLVSNVTKYTTRIPHKSLYFDLLSGNLKNCKNMVFFSFDFIVFNIMICPMTFV
jgi:hypothetical protein